MDFTMRILKNIHRELLWLTAALLLCLDIPFALADFKLTSVEAVSDGGLLQVNADAELELPAETQKALESGVDLRIQFLIELVKERNWIWDNAIRNWEMLFTLHYHQLSGQYILATPASDNIKAFNTAEQALDALSDELSFNLGYQESFKVYSRLYIRSRIKLDTKYLPAPLKLFSLVFSDWKLDSGWKEWVLEL